LIRERERSRHTPIIFLTGAYEDVHSVVSRVRGGTVDYIVKPLVPEILKSKISVFVELYIKNAVLIREIADRKLAEEHLRKSEENCAPWQLICNPCAKRNGRGSRARSTTSSASR